MAIPSIPTAGVSADNPLAPEYLALERQKKIADLLMQKGQELPQAQMVSGYYVPPSWTQQLGTLANAYMGGKMAEQNEAKTAKLAQLLKGQSIEELNKFSDLMKINPQEAYKFAAQSTNPQLQKMGMEKMLPEDITLSEGQKRIRISPTGEQTTLAQGEGKAHVVGNSLIVDGKEVYKGREKPIQIDTGTAIQFVDPETKKVVFSTPKQHVFAPHAPQIVDTVNGPMLVNSYTGQATPIMANGQALPPKLGAEQTKDIVGINQQRQTIKGAIKDVEQHPNAFSFGRGMAQNLPYGETVAGRLETPEQTQTRAYVFNNVSSIIKERAGTAQSASELQRLNSFLPGPNDNATQIINKLKGFEKYLDDYEKGTRSNPNIQTNPQVSNDGFTIRRKE